MNLRRIAVFGLASALLTGCAAQRPRSVRNDGRYCFKVGKRPVRTCTPMPVPSEQVEAEVKRFEPTPGMLTLFIVRKRWADPVNRVDISVDGAGPITTVPESFIRARVPPGSHRLAFIWDGTETAIQVDGAAGEVRFIELEGSTWAWSSRYRWSTSDPAGACARALSSRLIAVKDLQQ